MNIEQEGGIGEGPYMPPSGGSDIGALDSGDGGWIKAVVVGAFGIVTTAIGLLYKKNRSGQSLEDATNDITVETLQSARLYIVELENKNKAMLTEMSSLVRAQLDSEAAASRAAVQASLASEAAVRAQEAATRAQTEATETRRLLASSQAYVRLMRSAMIAAGVEVPPEPTS